MGFFVSSQASKLKHNPKKANVEKTAFGDSESLQKFQQLAIRCIMTSITDSKV